ncbi:hypothetical protein GCM10011351_08450 [Paraliobacillus quinghaiensis]|uniref:Diguanylate cyclase n=1 Tax=Paraliobacillus quinghaiensis TaxID=470815 RepID=A0A917WSF7_9BACI|nr:hypothetical protein GCM10011351_08450 [Paraliobacillus quinghaiensis]
MERWKHSDAITYEELYQFLKEITNSAHHIKLNNLSEVASTLLNEMDNQPEKLWSEEEWSNFIQPLILLFSGEDTKVISRRSVLLVDDNMDSLNYLKEELEERNYEVLMATKIQRAMQMFYDYHPDIILINGYLKEEGKILNILNQFSQRASETMIPIFVIGEKDSDHLKVKVYDAGATDFIEMPIQYEVLDSLLRNRLRQQFYFKKNVLVDELTQAFNRISLVNIWKGLYKKFTDRDQTFSLALIDLDYFKRVNDQYGHAVGDVILKNFSTYILEHKRQQDAFIRYGGEEFILLMPELMLGEAAEFINQLLQGFTKVAHQVKEDEIHISFTAGVAEMTKEIDKMELLIEQSDRALYYGKEQGRKRVEVYQSELYNDPEFSKLQPVLKIAIVDDDRFIQRVLHDKLNKLEIEPYKIENTTFKDGETFLSSDWYKGREKKIVLLDGVLPKMDGLEVLNLLREMVNETELGIIMLTGRKKDSDMVKALELGADDYITKPFSLEQLEARIKRLVKRLFTK